MKIFFCNSNASSMKSATTKLSEMQPLNGEFVTDRSSVNTSNWLRWFPRLCILNKFSLSSQQPFVNFISVIKQQLPTLYSFNQISLNSISCNLLRPCSRDRYVSDLFWSRQTCDMIQCECSAATFRMWTHINSGRGCHPLVSTDTIQCLFPRTSLLFLSSLSSLLFVKIRGWSWNAFEWWI
jgi:hypothetical protein